MKSENFIDFSWILNVAIRRKWLILCLLAATVVGTFVLFSHLPPKNKATTTLMIEPSEDYKTNDLNVLMAGERLALTYSHIINSQPVLENAIFNLHEKISVADLADMITVQPLENTQLVQLSVIHPSPDKAVALANAISESFLAYIKNLSSENYTQSLDNYQKNIDLKQAEIDSIISDISDRNQQKGDLAAELTVLQSQQSQKQDDYRILQQNIQSLEMQTLSDFSKMIYTIQPAFISSTGTPPHDVSSVLIFFSNDVITNTTDTTFRIGDQIAQTYGPMLSQEGLLTQVISQLKLSETPASLSRRISYEPVTGTQLLRLNVNVTNGDLAGANTIATAIADLFVEQSQGILAKSYTNKLSSLKSQMGDLSAQLIAIQDQMNNNSAKTIPINLELDWLTSELSTKYADLRDLQGSYDQLAIEEKRAANTVVITEPATHAKSLALNNYIYAGLFLFLGLAASTGLLFVVENMDDKIRTPVDITGLLDKKPVGVIGHITKTDGKYISESNPSPFVTEDFRKLSARVRPTFKDLPVRTLLVTSPNSSEGKSLVAANLGVVFARTGTSVIIVDADLHLPRQHAIFDVNEKGGLADCLISNQVDFLLKPTKVENLCLLTSGTLPEEPVELLSGPYLEKILNKLSDMADLVIVDCSPIITLSDASYLTPFVDGALLVLRSGATKRKAALEASTLLKNADLKFFGVVLNDAVMHHDSYYQYYDTRPLEAKSTPLRKAIKLKLPFRWPFRK